MSALAALLQALLLASITPAHATCPASEPVISELTCSSSVTGRIAGRDPSHLGGVCGSSACYSCGSPTPGVTQTQAEDVYSFTCQRTGTVAFEMSGLDCNLDIYVLDSTCDPYAGCVQGTNHAGSAIDGVTFSCTAGQTYYIVVEGYGFGLGGAMSGACSSPDSGDYTISFNLASSTGCSEDCDNGSDDDLDGYTDCADSDCATDPICANDVDHDGYIDATYGGDDCDDGNASVNPAATEYCDGIDNNCNASTDESTAVDAYTYYRDADSDSYGSASTSVDSCTTPAGYVLDYTDCDDTRASTYPGAAEACDSRDNDCDGSVDEGLGTTWYRDADSDGYGTSATSAVACSAPAGYVSNASDCNDAAATISPAAAETCDSVDNDCDGSVDEGLTSTWYADTDGDGYGNPGSTVSACSAPAGYVANATDCDDSRRSVFPGAAESCDSIDNDCDGTVDEGVTRTYYRDADSDTYGTSSTSTSACSAPAGYVSTSSDCDDGRSSVYPGAPEYCNGRDDDCDGSADEAGAVDGTTWYRDADSDTYGTSGTSTSACSAPAGYVADGTDCDDTRNVTYPGAPEACDGRDNDCDGSVDESAGLTFYRDADGDGYGTSSTTSVACTAPAGYVSIAGDCNDAAAAINPAAAETCDSTDNDCDGSVDEGLSVTWYRDADTDGYGSASTTTSACSAPAGYVATATDCDDTRSTTYPGAAETCDSADNDCDGSVDEGVTRTWYRDADGDAYGTTGTSADACSAPAGYVAVSSDCDDTRSSVYPGASEYCNGRDDDCDGSTDEAGAVDGTTWYRDADSDAYGAAATSTTSCSAPAGYVPDATDCDDTRNTTYPGAPEACDGRDNDCDGTIDDGSGLSFYADADGDGYGDAGVAVTACAAPAGYVSDDNDCDDANAAVSPSATEVCNGIDDDCDVAIDESGGSTWYADADGDSWGSASSTVSSCTAPGGYVAVSGDCDDAVATAYPGATEWCDGFDNDCDGSTDESTSADAYAWYRDADGDGYGASATTVDACVQPSGYVADATDCDDTRAATHPSATETCNGIDDDCDGTADNGVGTTWYRDADSDGYGTAGTPSVNCTAPVGYVATAGDCNDASAAISPAATEVCDTIDNDCDGSADEGLGSTWYADSDADGYGNVSVPTTNCATPAGYVADSSDCDDGAATVHPGAAETCNSVDDDCDGSIDEGTGTTWYADADADGFGNSTVTAAGCTRPAGYVSVGTDCDDTIATVHPGATETCDGLDDDCDGSVDETGGITWYVDADADGYGSTAAARNDCNQPAGYVSNSSDCDDAQSANNPAGTEICDSADNDCDGAVDEDGGATWYADADGDAFGDPAVTQANCVTPSGYVGDATDCNDADATVFPGATEVCDSLDNDCDAVVDEDAADATIWYEDADSDGHGNAAVAEYGCGAPTGFVALGDDCWDGDATVHPGAGETADGVDENCDGLVDESSDAYDDDGDGYAELGGDCDDTLDTVHPGAEEACDSLDEDCDGRTDEGTSCVDDDGDGVSDDDGDCNDGDAAVSPDHPEVDLNGVDDDCDGVIDGGADDDDGDGYGEAGGDCDDAAASVYPGAPEADDGLDNDCDGTVDEGTAGFDDDRDGQTEAAGDCDDTDPSSYVGAVEVADGVDNDCNGAVDEGTELTDDDGDGFSEEAGDCDDADPTVNPAGEENADGVDDDCDGQVDDGMEDFDGDGFTIGQGDCNDFDGFTNPSAYEVCDLHDNNCNGSVDETCTEEVAQAPGCTCGVATPGAAAAWGMIGLVAVLSRRRRAA